MSYYYAPQPVPSPKRNPVNVALIIVFALLTMCCAGLVIALANGAGSGDGKGVGTIVTPQTLPAPSKSATAAKVAKSPTAPAPIRAGTWEVGTEVKPGTYTTTADDHCYWARLKDFDGTLDSIIANGNLGPGEHGRITVKKTDKGIELSGDCLWSKR